MRDRDRMSQCEQVCVCVLNIVPEMCGVGVTAESVCVSTVHHGPAVLCAVN